MSKDNFRMHIDNLKKSEENFKKVSIIAKNEIKKQTGESELYIHLLLLISGTIIENSYYSLIYNYDLYEEEDTNIFLQDRREALQEKWKNLLSYTVIGQMNLSDDYYTSSEFSRKYGRTLGIQISEIFKIIDFEVKEMILCRNKLAHGEFKYAFNNDKTSFSESNTVMIRKQNYYDCLRKIKMFKIMKTLIHNYRQNVKAFQRDFDKYYVDILRVQKDFSSEKYKCFERNIISAYERGLLYKKKNNNS